MLRQEISILKELSHPSIITYKHSFEFKHQLFLVIELWIGGTLQNLIEEHAKNNRSSNESTNKIFSDEDASKIMKSILEGVSYLHSKGIVHRDLKPENILLENKGDISKLKIIDFGLTAKYNDACPMSLLDTQWGTILYMAPEVALKQEYSKSIDIWSLGIIMYNLLSGGAHPLYITGDSTEKYKLKLLNKDKLYFSESFSTLAKDLIKKMTSYSPIHRYTVDQALKHPWITRTHDTKVPLTCLEMFKNFDSEDKLK